jgi:hypothetical protein
MSRPFKITSPASESWLTMIAEMDREELIAQFRTYPAPFPVDFTDDFLRGQSIDKLRHVFAGLVMHCGIAPKRAITSSATAPSDFFPTAMAA